MKLLIPMACCILLASCGPEDAPKKVDKTQSIVVKAPDYKPIGESFKMFSFALIAVALIKGITNIMVEKGGHR